ncbi:MAG: hypothetical protein L0271_06405 [Gemmatimonadetes bacterium]|nr:hypothetical protein [Gemmatimonadota bacterium]
MLGIRGAGTDPGRRFYGSINFRPSRIEGKRLSSYIDCGMGPTATPKADEYEVSMRLTSAPRSTAETTTVVQTVLEATAKPRATAGQRVTCQSNGTLEKRVGDLLLMMLVPR